MTRRLEGYPLCKILFTISIILVPSAIAKYMDRQAAIEADNMSVSPYMPATSLFAEDRSINVPINTCDSSDQRRYADLTEAFLDPPCEKASQGFCGIQKGRNYTLSAKFLSKVSTKGLSVRVTSIDPTYGWETPVWPEFSVCSGFNITCPQNPNTLVQAYLHDSLPQEFPAMRALVRVRLLGIDQHNFKRVYICRQIKIHVY